MAERRDRRDFTRTEAADRLSYNSETGEFHWIGKPRPGFKVGTRAGGVVSYGYRAIRIDRILYPEHRLAFLFMTGRIPEEVDHRNGDRSDNRWVNLREATRTENTRNVTVRCNSRSGVKGVSWDEATQKWRAHIWVAPKNVHLGLFADKRDAVVARHAAELKHHGDFALSARR